MTDKELLIIARKALRRIANLNESDCAKYVAKADAIALDAVITIDLALEAQE